jgi:hypothetical protein
MVAKKQYQEVEATKVIDERSELFASSGGHDAF